MSFTSVRTVPYARPEDDCDDQSTVVHNRKGSMVAAEEEVKEFEC